MIQSLLGREWQEVKSELESKDLPYTYQISRPHGKMETWGDCRVIRAREVNDRLELVIAHEKFSLRQK